MSKIIKTIIGMVIGGFLSMSIFSKMEEWMPAEIPVPGMSNTYTSGPVLNFAAMGLVEWIMFFVIFILPIIICVISLLLTEGYYFGIENAVQMILGLAAGIFTSIFIMNCLVRWNFWDFQGLYFGNYTWKDWIWFIVIAILPTVLALVGSISSCDWGRFFLYGILLPFVCSIIMNIGIIIAMVLIEAFTSGAGFVSAALFLVFLTLASIPVIRIYII